VIGARKTQNGKRKRERSTVTKLTNHKVTVSIGTGKILVGEDHRGKDGTKSNRYSGE